MNKLSELFSDCDITDYEKGIVENVIDNIAKQGNKNPTMDDLLHELIRLSDIALRHLIGE